MESVEIDTSRLASNSQPTKDNSVNSTDVQEKVEVIQPDQLKKVANVASIRCVKLNISTNECDKCLWISSAENLDKVHVNVRQRGISTSDDKGTYNTEYSRLTVHGHYAEFENVTDETAEGLSNIFLHLPAYMLQQVQISFVLIAVLKVNYL